MNRWFSATIITLGMTAGNFLYQRFFHSTPDYLTAAQDSFMNMTGIVTYLLFARK
jgi:hypothetical protein